MDTLTGINENLSGPSGDVELNESLDEVTSEVEDDSGDNNGNVPTEKVEFYSTTFLEVFAPTSGFEKRLEDLDDHNILDLCNLLRPTENRILSLLNPGKVLKIISKDTAYLGKDENLAKALYHHDKHDTQKPEPVNLARFMLQHQSTYGEELNIQMLAYIVTRGMTVFVYHPDVLDIINRCSRSGYGVAKAVSQLHWNVQEQQRKKQANKGTFWEIGLLMNSSKLYKPEVPEVDRPFVIFTPTSETGSSNGSMIGDEQLIDLEEAKKILSQKTGSKKR